MDCSSAEGPTEIYAVYLDVKLQIMIFEKMFQWLGRAPNASNDTQGWKKLEGVKFYELNLKTLPKKHFLFDSLVDFQRNFTDVLRNTTEHCSFWAQCAILRKQMCV